LKNDGEREKGKAGKITVFQNLRIVTFAIENRRILKTGYPQ